MWTWLMCAIAADVAATVGLRAGDGFHATPLSAAVVIGYAFASYALSRSLSEGMRIGVAYAVWGGVGLGAVAAISVVVFDESLTGLQIAGLGSIVVGLIVLKLGGIPDVPVRESSES